MKTAVFFFSNFIDEITNVGLGYNLLSEEKRLGADKVMDESFYSYIYEVVIYLQIYIEICKVLYHSKRKW